MQELVACGVEMDAERREFEPLGYGEGKDLERDAWVGLLAETGRQGAVFASWKRYATLRGR